MIALLLASSWGIAAETPRANNPDAGTLSEVVASPEVAQPGGPMVVEARVPVELMVDGVKIAQLWYPGTARFDIVGGPHVVRVYVDGNPQDVSVEIQPGHETHVLVGRSGISVTKAEVAAPGPVDAVSVELRVVGGGAAQVRVDGARHTLSGGDRLTLSLPPGPHAMSVRSSDGTAIWAAGTLSLTGGAPVVVQITEGRMPEVGGPGRFDPGGG
jgi:hypothetical protein